MRFRNGSIGALFAFVAGCLAAGHASAVAIEVDGGLFQPWKGDAGWYVSGSAFGENASGKARFGGEFEYREFSATGPSVVVPIGNNLGTTADFSPDADWQTWAIRFVFQYHFMPDAVVQPYIGFGIGPTINKFDDTPYQQAVAQLNQSFGGAVLITLDTQEIGAGIEVTGVLGVTVRMPGVEWLSLYAEGMVGYDAVFATQISPFGGSEIEVLNLGGLNVGGGVLFRF